MYMYEIDIQPWELLLFVGSIFGLAPTMTLLFSLPVGYLYKRMDLGWLCGLISAAVSCPASFGVYVLTVRKISDLTEDSGNLVSLLVFSSPAIGVGLVFSLFSALWIYSRASEGETLFGAPYKPPNN